MSAAWVGGALALVPAAALAGAAAGAWRWQRLSRELHAGLDAVTATSAPYGAGDAAAAAFTALPPAVKRYLQLALREGMPPIDSVTLEQRGEFNLATDGERWVPFHARQRVTLERPGFVWDARIAALPGLAVHVHDAYVAGEGILHAALLGLIDLARLRDRGHTARGELMRFLSEAVWFPSALCPGPALRWDAIDARQARATLSDGAVSASLSFCFRADGLIDSVHAEDRGRTVGRQIVPTPWEGRWSDWREHDGAVVPFRGEVAWLLPEGRRPYWRGAITALAYRQVDR
jgi:hypothetical protein